MHALSIFKCWSVFFRVFLFIWMYLCVFVRARRATKVVKFTDFCFCCLNLKHFRTVLVCEHSGRCRHIYIYLNKHFCARVCVCLNCLFQQKHTYIDTDIHTHTHIYRWVPTDEDVAITKALHTYTHTKIHIHTIMYICI